MPTDALLELFCGGPPSFGSLNMAAQWELLLKWDDFLTLVSLCHTCCIFPMTQRLLHKYALQLDFANYGLMLAVYF